MSDRISASGTAVLFKELRGQSRWNEPFVFTNESQVPLWAAVPVLRLVEDKKGEHMFGKEGCIIEPRSGCPPVLRTQNGI